METALPGKGSRSDLPSELGFALAPRETDPTPVVTRSSEVSRVEPTSAMVTRSRAREGHGIGNVPEIEFRLETETRLEPEPCPLSVREVWQPLHHPSPTPLVSICNCRQTGSHSCIHY